MNVATFFAPVLDLFNLTWIRVALSNMLILLAGLFTNLLSSDITGAPGLAWYQHLASRYVVALCLILVVNTWMQMRLEPSSGFRTKADFRETLRRGVSRELLQEMRNVIRGGEQGFLTRDEVKALLGLDND